MVAVALLVGQAGYAQEAAAHLEARIASGQTVFHIGERIPVELAFDGPDDKQLEINMASYDRSGRMNYESFAVSPEGWTDPLKTYFATGGFMGGGLTTFAALSPKPVLIRIDLNEWVRFDRPGNYTVIVTSRRVTRIGAGIPQGLSDGNAAELKSNPLHLRIVAAAKKWQEAKLAEISETLADTTAQPGVPAPARGAAIADLRFLGSVDAVKRMAQNLREDEPDLMVGCALGLAGLPPKLHARAVAELKKVVTEAGSPVSGLLLNILAVLQLEEADAGSMEAERAQLDEADWMLALDAVSNKTGKARAATVQTLMNWQPEGISAERKAGLGRMLAANFENLSPQLQAADLRYNWDSIGSAEMLPVLRRLAQTALQHPGSHLVKDYTTEELKSVALRRWYELDPEGAREEILRQIGTASPSLTAESLGFLSEEKLPQFESLWAEEYLKTGEDVLVGLMIRFGTGNSVALIRDKVQAQIDASMCNSPAAAMAYLVKFDPESSLPLTERLVKEYGKDGKPHCNRGLFQEIARSATDPILNEAAIDALDDPDPQVNADAAIYLRNYGDASVEAALWEHYVAWNDRWSGHAEELESREAGSVGNWEQIGVGEDLALALMANQGWVASPELISRVLGKCVGMQMCDQLRQMASMAGGEPHNLVAGYADSHSTFSIDQYQPQSLELLEAKIAQYPRGTRISLVPTMPMNTDQQRLNEKVKALLEKHGMVMQ